MLLLATCHGLTAPAICLHGRQGKMWDAEWNLGNPAVHMGGSACAKPAYFWSISYMIYISLGGQVFRRRTRECKTLNQCEPRLFMEIDQFSQLAIGIGNSRNKYWQLVTAMRVAIGIGNARYPWSIAESRRLVDKQTEGG
jgi:hypothetical protein